MKWLFSVFMICNRGLVSCKALNWSDAVLLLPSTMELITVLSQVTSPMSIRGLKYATTSSNGLMFESKLNHVAGGRVHNCRACKKWREHKGEK